ncbi:DNA segregation ATPase FtsK/SpoIIIE, S-DNA-T family [Amphibacillus marinus]|uniref:DNA segregation ATPase FtsK/SpoIIIE, S-DNA-T family n=1 Tax=Amphibacillus marinus TaxID=872970 RepID=A0A1H8TVG9_9BACI|nr:type VII secretion protein EssC [Amphibacillus marinus]SEO94845.1 DNA segregation ATPase FtsK/SpoIIIE, S-DNA-T family [Amphibacillus marinus]
MNYKTLVVLYKGIMHKATLPIDTSKEIFIGNRSNHTITIASLEPTIAIVWDGQTCLINQELFDQYLLISLENGESITFYLIDDSRTFLYDLAAENTVTISRHNYDDIVIQDIEANLVLYREHYGFKLVKYDGQVFHNGRKVEKNGLLEYGDQLFFNGVRLMIWQEEVRVFPSQKRVTSKLIGLTKKVDPYSTTYPDYHRSPRIIYREREEKKTIANPAHKPNKPSEQLARTIVPPLIMVFASIVMSFFQPGGSYIFLMLAMTLSTVVFSVSSYFKNLKQYRIDMKERTEAYQHYLDQKTKELYDAAQEQYHALTYHYPSVAMVRQMALEVNARIYEKTKYHHDFLHFRAGLGDVESSFEIEFSDEEFTQERDALLNQARELRSQFEVLENVPIVSALTNGPVGYIGHRALVVEQLQLLILQLALFHSYHDVQFVTIFPENEKHSWDWMRWLQHAKLQELNVRGNIYHERSRDQVLHSLYQVLKGRKQQLDEKGNTNEKLTFTPQYIVFITHEQLIIDHIIMEFFNENPQELGVSLVFVQDVMQSLPEHVNTVIDIRDFKSGNIILEKGELVNKAFKPDHFPEIFDKEEVSRALAPLNHLQSLKNSIPESVTFLEMYGVEMVEELDITQRWLTNESYKTMAVPLGLRGANDVVQLNLHEKAHGPHGLVAGTTGSGKSEIIQSYILSLAVNFHPYEVSFLLIDYKGGGMANLFKHLPHLLGTITNLEKAQSMRALASIKAELQKRQRLFGEHDVNHINQYQKLYKQEKASEPMPHLFLISDEFAELKAEQPDFMQELVSTARIGRSLGIHLILATQKPSGVVDDQIWSNSKFKLALKVQNASDSNEVLKTPDAADITLPGRAYLQVGNNEIYELFQSAWSGADYIPDKEDPDYIDTTIYGINDLGQYNILTQDLSGLDRRDKVGSVPSELDAVIEYIQDYAEVHQIAPLPRPWLPPLPERIYASELTDAHFQKDWQADKGPLELVIGMLDQPELQKQAPLAIDLSKDGHLAIFSSPGYGKSTFLQSMVMHLAHRHTPSQLHFYLLDFGTNGLLPLRQLPHVADTLLIDESEKLGKWIRIMTNQINDRKKKLSEYGVADLAMYERASGEAIPYICITIDNYDSVKEADFEEEFSKVITQIAREGASIGIHLAISAGRQSSMRMPLISNIKRQIALYMIDDIEVRTIVGSTEVDIEEIAGRGLIKLESAVLFQTMLPAVGEDTLEMIESMQTAAKEMDDAWSGDRPDEIPMMPDGAINFEQYKQKRKTKQLIKSKQLPLGLDFESVSPIGFNPELEGLLMVMSDRKDGLEKLTNALGQNLSLLKNSLDTTIFDAADGALKPLASEIGSYYGNTDAILSAKEALIEEINGRSGGYLDNDQQIILIKDLDDFVERSDLDDDESEILFEQGPAVNIYYVVCGTTDYIATSYERTAKLIRKLATVGLISMRLSDQDLFSQPFIRKESYPKPFEAYYVREHEHIKIKVTQ